MSATKSWLLARSRIWPDAELVRIAAYSGLRRGELVTLRWRDISFTGRKITVSRTLSADVEATSTKSGRFREVPLPDQAAGALDRLSQRADYTGPDEYVFCNRFGRRLDASALRRRYERARNAANLPSLRFHDLRHTYGSLLVEGGLKSDYDGLSEYFAALRAAFDDRRIERRIVLVEGSRIAFQTRIEGTFVRPFPIRRWGC